MHCVNPVGSITAAAISLAGTGCIFVRLWCKIELISIPKLKEVCSEFLVRNSYSLGFDTPKGRKNCQLDTQPATLVESWVEFTGTRAAFLAARTETDSVLHHKLATLKLTYPGGRESWL
jgi:hypothetical protein